MNQLRFQRFMKVFWLTFGIFGVLPIPIADHIRNSIAILFFISVYANFISHWSNERALEAKYAAQEDSKS